MDKSDKRIIVATPGDMSSYSRREFMGYSLAAGMGALGFESIAQGDSVLASANRKKIKVLGQVSTSQGSVLPDVAVSDCIQVVKTNQDGAYEMIVDVIDDFPPIISVTTPSGFKIDWHQFFRRIENCQDGKTYEVDFELMPDLSVLPGDFCFAHVTDCHVCDSDNANRVSSILETVCEHWEKPAFILLSGDLVNIGDDQPQWDSYHKAVTQTRLPILTCPGNHDCTEGLDKGLNGPFQLPDYQRLIGPRRFSFQYQGIHFVLCDTMSPGWRQWLQRDLEAKPKQMPVIYTQHYYPTDVLELLDQYDCTACLSGHWHCNKIVRYNDILNINSVCTWYGGNDTSVAGFRIIRVKGGGRNIETEQRWSYYTDHFKLVHGSGLATAASGVVLAASYDTAQKTTEITATVENKRIGFEQLGPVLWEAKLETVA